MLKKTLSFMALSAFALTIAIPLSQAANSKFNTAEARDTFKIQKKEAVIYEDTVSSVLENNRMWPTVNVWKKVGNSEPEFLAQVGKVGEYPLQYVLSPDKKTLLINLESKLQRLDLETKSLTDLFLPMKQVESAIFSPDGKKVLVWDQIYASEDYEYYVHSIDLMTGQSTSLKHGNTDGKYFFIKAWREDNIVFLNQAMGEAAKLWMFDIETGELKIAAQISEDPYLSGAMSKKGSYFALLDTTVSDRCNAFWGEAYSTYNVLDSLTGKTVATFGDAQKATDIIGFSKNEQALLYRTWTPWNDEAQCEQAPAYQYHLLWIKSGKVVPISNPKPLYALMDIAAFDPALDPNYSVLVKYFAP